MPKNKPASSRKTVTPGRRRKPRKRSPAKKNTARKSSRASNSNNRGNNRKRLLPWWKRQYSYLLALAFLLLGSGYVLYLNALVTERFEGRLWSIPSKVFARPLNLAPGMVLDPDGFEYELGLMQYEKVSGIPQHQGQYRRWQNTFEMISREFQVGRETRPSRALRLIFEGQQLVTLESLFGGDAIDRHELDPALIASIYPKQAEDRELLRLSDVPERLVKTLIAVEDRSFYSHWGVNPLAILRAIVVNLKAGERVQGGSTLTQQLVKNLFLSSERSYWRKLKEAIMSVLLELHYDKRSILEAYLNEVYLGQAGKASINGFALGSQFYFNRPLEKLTTDQIALLIGLIKGPSYFNPRKNPQRALERRNLVLDVMLQQEVISKLHYERFIKRGLGVVDRIPETGVRHPAFVDLLKRQLRSRFSDEMLKREGLQIYSTLDPQVQRAAEQAVTSRLEQIQQRAIDIPLQAAVVVSDVASSEVLALLGDRNTAYQGFNRALDASRQIGSLIKPAIYLAALNRDEGDFNLATVLSDEPLALRSRNGDVWQPQNYDRKYRGNVLLYDALVHSYNVPSVRLGLKIGLADIAATLRNLGLQKEVPVYPSMLLGAFELTPFEVATVYQTIANRGRRLPLHAIRYVLSHDGEPLVHFADQHSYTVDENVTYLLRFALNGVTKNGTAKSLSKYNFRVAGKTGTTDDLRDSWYAGFSEDRLAVVWVGNDDNLETGLTGASGALRIWTSLFEHMVFTDLDLSLPDSMELRTIDRNTGLLKSFGCGDRVELPFLQGSAPQAYTDCF